MCYSKNNVIRVKIQSYCSDLGIVFVRLLNIHSILYRVIILLEDNKIRK